MKHSKKQQSFVSVNSIVISLYLFVMLGIFPVYYKYQYAGMGDAKYKFFLYTSAVCVVVFFLLSLIGLPFYLKGKNNFVKIKELKLHSLDKAILIYFGITLLSFLFTPFKEMGFVGADGWNMGLLSQILFVSSYFLVAKAWPHEKWAVWLLMASSAMVLLIGVFHRFDVDIIPIYGDLDSYYKVLFLSTMGQSSWYSSFLCTVFPVGLYLFFNTENKKVRRFSGVYSVIAICSLVTQNTDSAYMSLAAVLLLLFNLSFDKKDGKRFIEVVILILGSFCFMGICQRIFVNRAIPLDKLSLFMSQSVVMWILLLAAVLYYLVFYCKKRQQNTKKADKKQKQTQRTRLPFWILLGMLGAGIVGGILFIVLNSNGVLLNCFGYQSTNNYLLFNEQWGNGRGFAWKHAVNAYGGFSFLQKLIGVGPDCFSAYIESVPEYLSDMKAFWGDLVLTNAHNEYLTKLYNLGMLGLFSYVGMLVTAIGLFIKKRNENDFLPAFALCTLSYMVHNIFCYEQVCNAPVFYILLGLGSGLIHNKDKKCIY